MKVLLIGEIYSINLGDPLLCESVEKLIREKYPDAEIVRLDMSGKVNFQDVYCRKDGFLNYRGKMDKARLYVNLLSNRALRKAFSRERFCYTAMWSALCTTLREHQFDLAVFAGGSLFMDYFAAPIYLIVKRLSRAHIKTIFHACGMGALGDAEKFLLRKAFMEKNVVHISLRDSNSRFRSLFPTQAKVIETYDTALGCSRYYAPAEKKIAQYGVGLIYKEEYFEEQVKLIRMLLQSQINWKAFTNGNVADMDAARRILQKAGIEQSKIERYLVRRPTTSEELVKTVTQFEHILSFRMHSQIVALSFGIPCYGIAWEPKVSELFSKLGFPQNQNDHVPSLTEILTALQSSSASMRDNALSQAQISRNHLYQGIRVAMEENQ